MRMILCPLFSGSSGNAVLAVLGGTRILVDAGVSARRITGALRTLGVGPEELDAVVVTHDHIDHIKGLPVLAKQLRAPIYANAGTWKGIDARCPGIPEERRAVFRTGEEFQAGGARIRPFAIPHDTADPVGFTLSCGAGRLGVATDLGHLSESWLRELEGCQALVLEANHDVEMLRRGPYPEHLKRRILSADGHLCNEDSGRALARLVRRGAQAAFLAHLSQENNLPETAGETVARQLEAEGIRPGDVWLTVARRDAPSAMLVLDL